MNNDVALFTSGVFLGFVLCIGLIFVSDLTYKQGQIDCMTGKIIYELKTNSDSSKTWELINEK